MENTGVKKYSSRRNPIETKKAKFQRTVLIARCFRHFNKIILWSMLLYFLMSPVFSEISQNTRSTRNTVAGSGRKVIFTKNGVFYGTNNDDASDHDHSSDSKMCLKEHKIEKRDAREEESFGSDRGKMKMHKKDRSMGDEEDEDFGLEISGETYDTMGECSSCDKDKVRIKFLEKIKDSILSKLGMSRPPNVTERPKPKIPDHLLMMLMKKRHHSSNGLYWIHDNGSEEMMGDEPYESRPSDKMRSRNGDHSNRNSFARSQGNISDKFINSYDFQEGEVSMDEEDDYHVQTERIVAFSQPHPKIRHLPHVQYFEFSDKVRSSKIRRALLWIYIKGRQASSILGNKISISIYKIIDAGKPGMSSSRESPVITSVRTDSTQFIPSGSGAWITMEYMQIKNLVSEWFKYPQHNLGIVITAEDANHTNLAVTGNNDTANAPFLEVYVTENRKHRTKRTVGLNCKDSSKETRCCRYPLTVDFVEFGWDWIIAPKKYEAFYCAGECPLAFLPQHPHTHIAQLSNIPGSGACCAPRKLSELDMLYFDQNMNIIFGKVPAMKVDRCGCT